MKRNELIKYLEKILKAKQFKKDRHSNKLFVRGKNEVNKIGVAVNSSLEAFKKAKSQKIDFLIVHHPSWAKKDPFFREKMDFMRKNKISLYVAHETMDDAIGFGMTDSLATEAGIKIKGRFCRFGAGYAGIYGTTKQSFNTFSKKLEKVLQNKVKIFKYSKKFGKVAIVTGGGVKTEWMSEAKKKGYDTFITGEGNFFAKLYAKEAEMNLILGSHYATEVLGMKYLAKKIKDDLKINPIFIKEENIEKI
ncbi:MAG: hypothetical protein GY861_27065 [bacterium]|nr:hypothetical protein [bacterium]